jgi:tRNA (Thr-GGU) A37 N-methylase
VVVEQARQIQGQQETKVSLVVQEEAEDQVPQLQQQAEVVMLVVFHLSKVKMVVMVTQVLITPALAAVAAEQMRMQEVM